MRILFSHLNKTVHEKYSVKDVVRDYSHLIADKINKSEEYFKNFFLKNPENEILLNRGFRPSKTAQNCLNFITKNDESNLPLDVDANSSEEIANIFKIIYILLKQNPNKVKNEMLVENLFNKIMVNLKIQNLSKNYILILETLFLNIICHNLTLNTEQYTKIIEIIEMNKQILNSAYVLRFNKIASYITFIIKEIYDYITLRTEDGLLLLNLKKKYHELKKMRDFLKKINNLLV
jgi:hypothetical protein